jgi:transglutaminase-like putative cysteine protease
MNSSKRSAEHANQMVEDLTNRADYLVSSDVVDWHHPEIRALASSLAAGEQEPANVARRCFEWVRDEIQHCMDFRRTEVTCEASDVLRHGTGFCYAKSHLLAALLRANDIPAGFCYQRLSFDGVGPPFCLHGLNAVWLAKYGWYRIDSRGNKPGVAAEFTPPVERLAFSIQIAGETDIEGVLAEPLSQVIAALERYETVAELAGDLPDVDGPFTC